ncbi:hypothetical protein F5879DRAFT_413954 [Lentinula edodes]|nr:hypothetical protein F5879DRAFT_413954 [Lentinula edodes]
MFPVSDFSFVYCGMATVAATMGYVYAKRRRVEPYSHSLALGDTASPNDDTVFVMESPAAYSKSDNEIHLSNSSEEIDTQSITVDTTTTVPAAWSLEPIISIPNPPVVRGPSLKRKQMHDHDENNIPLEYPYNLAALYPNKRCKTPPSSQTIEPTIPLPGESTQRSNETVTNPEPTPEILIEPVGDSLEQPASKRQRHGNEELEYSQAQRDDKTPLITTQLHSSTDLESECTPQVPPTTANDAFSSKVRPSG